MPRFPRLGRGEQDAPQAQEARTAEQTQPDQRPLTSGDPLAAPAPDRTTARPTGPFTSGDPLIGASAPPPPDPAASEPPVADTPPSDPAAEPPTVEFTPAPPPGAPAADAPIDVAEAPSPPLVEPSHGDVGEQPSGEVADAARDAVAEPSRGDIAEPGAASSAQPPAGDAPLWSAPGASGGTSSGDPLGGQSPIGDPLAPPSPLTPAAGDPLGAPAGAVSASAADAPTTVAPAVDPAGAAVPVEQAPEDAKPGFRERTRLRRRMRELRRLREISFRDLGGLSFELHRFGRDRSDLVTHKLQALEQIDTELRAIEGALDARRPLIELREPGIAACPRCATLHGTDANFCPGCGTPLRGSVVGEAGPLRVTPVDHQPDAPS